jgi:hypothetical protein
MIPKGLFTQIGMIIVAVAIIFTYVEPTFTKLAEVQDQIKLYQDKRAEVETVNWKLSNLVKQIDISKDDGRRLAAYLPDEIDEISIMRDLLLITNQSGALYSDVSYESQASQKSQSAKSTDNEQKIMPLAHNFSLSVEGTYSQIKNLLTLLEQNNYPLEIYGLDIAQTEGGFLSADLQITTYALNRSDDET